MKPNVGAILTQEDVDLVISMIDVVGAAERTIASASKGPAELLGLCLYELALALKGVNEKLDIVEMKRLVGDGEVGTA